MGIQAMNQIKFNQIMDKVMMFVFGILISTNGVIIWSLLNDF